MKPYIFLCFLLVYNPLIANFDTEYNHFAPSLRKIIQEKYIYPPLEDSVFFEKVFFSFFNNCDPDKVFFLHSDISFFSQYKKEFKEELDGINHWFLRKVDSVFTERILQFDKLLIEIEKKPLTFNTKEYFIQSPDYFCKNDSELKIRQLQCVKQLLLYKYYNYLKVDSFFNTSVFLKNEPSLRFKTIRELKNFRSTFLEGKMTFEKSLGVKLCKSIADQLDPHSIYLPMDIEGVNAVVFSKSEKIFGFYISENDKGQIIIDKILPGSVAWRCGELNDGDLFIAFRPYNGDWVNIEGESMQGANELFSTFSRDKIEIEIKKPDGLIKVVTLEKSNLKLDENFVRSWIINGDRKIGYIILPAFYTGENFEGVTGGCADDIAKEIVKLKEENIEGLILDLRNNSGGSLLETQRLAGMFINEGVIEIAKYRDGVIRSGKDPNRGTLFDLPLLVMINGSSASASELLSGALQDYNRAVITGSASYGKASSQITMPVDTNHLNDYKYDDLPLGTHYIKLTVGKTFLPSGRSCQSKGIIPDIELPGLHKAFGFEEANLPNCLKQDSVKRAVYFTPLPPLPIQELKKASQQRVEKDDAFVEIEKLRKLALEYKLYELDSLPLRIDDFLALKKNREQFEQYRTVKENRPAILNISNHFFDLEQMKVDVLRQTLNDKALKSISSDIYLKENYLIINNLISLFKK